MVDHPQSCSNSQTGHDKLSQCLMCWGAIKTCNLALEALSLVDFDGFWWVLDGFWWVLDGFWWFLMGFWWVCDGFWRVFDEFCWFLLFDLLFVDERPNKNEPGFVGFVWSAEAADQYYVPVNKTWRLNERMYGGLTGRVEQGWCLRQRQRVWMRCWDMLRYFGPKSIWGFNGDTSK